MTPRRKLRLILTCFLISNLVFLAAGCSKAAPDTGDYAYVSVPEARLRDRVAAVYNKVGTVKNGERVRILDRSANKNFVRVRTPEGNEGWVEQRYLVGQDIYDAFQKMARENANVPAQAVATTRLMMNMHVLPARDAEKLYQLAEGSKVELLKRASTPKQGLKALQREEQEKKKAELAEEGATAAGAAEKDSEVPDPDMVPEASGAKATPAMTNKAAARSRKKAAAAASAAASKSATEKAAAQLAEAGPIEDWWLVRDSQKRVGWVLGRMLDVDVPMEIAQYAEGDRIVAASVLNQVNDSTLGKKVPQYVVLMAEDKDGLPYDFDQVRVFTWNGRRSRYETAYRERKLNGVLPFSVGTEDFGKEGVLPTFTIHVKDESGQVVERKYKMNSVIVRRVLAPGEQPEKPERRVSKKRRMR